MLMCFYSQYRDSIDGHSSIDKVMLSTKTLKYTHPSLTRAVHATKGAYLKPLPTKVPVHLEYDLHLPQDLPSTHQDPLVLLHGLFGSKQNYKSVGKHLAKLLNSPVYAVDLRNHGNSPHAMPFDYLSMTVDVKNFIEEQDLRNVTVIGHSMGAKVAMCLALLHQDLVGRLVAVDNSPVSKPLGLNFTKDLEGMCALENSKSILKTEKRWREKGLKFLEQYEQDAAVRLFLISNLVNKITKFNYSDHGGIDYGDEFAHFRIPVNHLAQAGLKSIGDFPSKELKSLKFRGPSLFLKARHSEFINESTVSSIYHFFPQTALKTFDTNHWLISAQPEKFINAVRDFVKST